ncbi:acyltransferase family protein [Sphingobacterium gobiense]|uniref:Acyltransferase 3 domain-containing protein n=1 Tax=Sphingobacterium gobiense TaxID=1382456 RepID=A0A2S9JT70_9SPHI|nr:acyltransferase [Sphingobacterium gobiense]PRD56485.1 hypothetical protein C5749_04380 [Sphingobacterium gobiense]
MEYQQAEKRLSGVIESMRFPLIYLVVIAHMVSFETPRVTLSWDSQDIYTFVSEMISHNLAKLSVRCYFLISGYYLFKRFVEWNNDVYAGQLKKKIRTLLIPYLLWNLILIVAIYVKYHLFAYFGLGSPANNAADRAALVENSGYNLLWGMPINFPLWYMRDLICMTLISPFFYLVFKYLRIYGLLLLAVFYFTVHHTDIPGFSSTAVFFFGVGAYFAQHQKNPLLLSEGIKSQLLLLAAVLLLICTLLNGTVYHEYVLRLFVPIGAVALINIFDIINKKEGVRNVLAKLAPTSFFIYVAHEVYIINWLKGGWASLAINTSGWGKLLGYFIVPLLCIGVCIGLYSILKKISPALLGILTGGRMSRFVYKEGGKR